MSKVRHNVVLNILNSGWPPEIGLTELDSAHQVCFYIAGMDMAGYDARIWVIKPSGKRVYNSCVIDGQCVIADITNQMLAEKGKCLGQIKLVSTVDGSVTPGDFIFNVKCDLSGDGLESKNESTVFENMLADVIENMGIDPTLTKAGYAADAAVVGEKISGLLEQNVARANSLWAIIQKTAFAEALTDEELTAFKTTWGIESSGDDSGETEVTLSSISATYSGGSVLVGTSVNDLTGIVVTANYSDGSTATVAGYTLSGTIAEGSNTVTISYGGKSTTITVIGYAEDEEEITLSSISATYTGGSVTVGTALTSLTGITVTGTYSDGSTSEITGYTLSGEIVEGENTVTVSYGGKTTTFTVTGVVESGGEVQTEILNTYTKISGTSVDLSTYAYTEGTSYNPFVIKQGTLLANKCTLTWNTEECNGFQIGIFCFDANGNPYKASGSNVAFSNPWSGEIEFTWKEPGETYYLAAVVGGNISFDLPAECTFMTLIRRSSGEGTLVSSNVTFYNWVTSGGITLTAIRE